MVVACLIGGDSRLHLVLRTGPLSFLCTGPVPVSCWSTLRPTPGRCTPRSRNSCAARCGPGGWRRRAAAVEPRARGRAGRLARRRGRGVRPAGRRGLSLRPPRLGTARRGGGHGDDRAGARAAPGAATVRPAARHARPLPVPACGMGGRAAACAARGRRRRSRLPAAGRPSAAPARAGRLPRPRPRRAGGARADSGLRRRRGGGRAGRPAFCAPAAPAASPSRTRATPARAS